MVKETFGQLIRRLRKEHKLPLRKVASILDIDTSTLSKIERNERSLNKEMLVTLSGLFDADLTELTIIYLSDKVAYELISENCSEEVLKVAEEKILYFRTNNTNKIS